LLRDRAQDRRRFNVGCSVGDPGEFRRLTPHDGTLAAPNFGNLPLGILRGLVHRLLANT
jgi:hypothetical protein